MDTLGSSAQPTAACPIGTRQCVFCLEDIRPGASVCPHCGSNLAPLQHLADAQAALEQRLALLEKEIATQRLAHVTDEPTGEATASVQSQVSPPAASTILTWPHMLDNIFLGLAALLAAHWLATTLPASNRTVFRLVALAVALPFGFRFELNSRAGTAGQVLAALAFGSLGTLAIGLLDAAVAGHGAPPTAQDIAASVATIALSHYAGSALAHLRMARAERRTIEADDVRRVGSLAAADKSLIHFEPARIKSTADTVKALYDAAAPLAAGAAALWAALGHFLS